MSGPRVTWTGVGAPALAAALRARGVEVEPAGDRVSFGGGSWPTGYTFGLPDTPISIGLEGAYLVIEAPRTVATLISLWPGLPLAGFVWGRTCRLTIRAPEAPFRIELPAAGALELVLAP